MRSMFLFQLLQNNNNDDCINFRRVTILISAKERNKATIINNRKQKSTTMKSLSIILAAALILGASAKGLPVAFRVNYSNVNAYCTTNSEKVRFKQSLARAAKIALDDNGYNWRTGQLIACDAEDGEECVEVQEINDGKGKGKGKGGKRNLRGLAEHEAAFLCEYIRDEVWPELNGIPQCVYESPDFRFNPRNCRLLV